MLEPITWTSGYLPSSFIIVCTWWVKMKAGAWFTDGWLIYFLFLSLLLSSLNADPNDQHALIDNGTPNNAVWKGTISLSTYHVRDTVLGLQRFFFKRYILHMSCMLILCRDTTLNISEVLANDLVAPPWISFLLWSLLIWKSLTD